MATTPYNPLDKRALAKSIQTELLSYDPEPFENCTDIVGAGVYAIYYTGDCEYYADLAAMNRDGRFAMPIYVGKAIPKGGRKGGLSLNSAEGKSLAERVTKHCSSIRFAENLDPADFRVRVLVVDDIWIPLGENILIETFRPVWNVVVDGFGNNDPGARRATQYRSAWDIIHPGRDWVTKHDLAFNPKHSVESIAEAIRAHLKP